MQLIQRQYIACHMDLPSQSPYSVNHLFSKVERRSNANELSCPAGGSHVTSIARKHQQSLGSGLDAFIAQSVYGTKRAAELPTTLTSQQY
ncbi:MAG: hypothetical protein AB8B70_06510 [Prochlorococcus sp.]